ncbi:MAG TPA: class I SAM-dependent methyltransferase [Bacteroidales bacterium]|nr:class I SAM-dependent methyltransferase [Bacteroidales bacterium]
MRNLVKAADALRQLVKNPWLLNKLFDEELYWRKKVLRKRKFENGLPVLDLSTFFEKATETVSPYAFLDGGSLPTDLALLRALARRFKVENYLEIGTWRGESVANVAPLVKNAVTINLPDDSMRKIGHSEEYIMQHRVFSSNLPNVVHLQANSLKFDFRSLGNDYGLAFIDGDHHYEAVKSDTRNVLHCLHPLGIIVWHDYGLNPEQVRWSVLAGILDGLPSAMHHRLFHVSNTKCAVYFPVGTIERLQVIQLQGPTTERYFEIMIRIKP